MAVSNKLTALAASRLKAPGRYSDGGNLYLQVSDTGGKSWLFRYMLDGRSREMGLGAFDLVSLSEARDAARQCRKLLSQRIDPIDQRRQAHMESALAKAKAVTFETCAREFVEDQRPGWKNAKHADQWLSTLESWVFPIIGGLPVDGITTDLVLRILRQPIGPEDDAPIFWNARTETASRVRGRIESVLDWARARKLRSDTENPARWKGSLDKLLPSKSQVAPVESHPALPYKQMPAFMVDLTHRDGMGAMALRFTILTAARTNETVGAMWSEIDEKEKLWIVPKDRMKGKRGTRKRDHVVPLSDEALDLLAGLPRAGQFVFPGGKADEPISTAAMAAVVARMNEHRAERDLPKWTDPHQGGREVVPHGFRSSFKDWVVEETEYPNEMSEMALSHALPDKVEAAYRRGNMRERRRRMMQHWSAYCLSKPWVEGDNVIPLRAF